MIIFSSEENKKEFIKNFDTYVSNLKKLKRLTADTAVTFSDFINTTWLGLENWEKKEKKKEVTKFTNTYIEITNGKEPVEKIKEIRHEHLEIADDKYEYLVSLIQQKIEDGYTADKLKSQNENLIVEMCKSFGETEEVAIKVIKELGAEALGKFFIMDRVSAGVQKGREILFKSEGQ